MSDPLKQQLVEAARLAYNRGMVNAYEGNLSLRNGDRVYITPSGVSKGLLDEDMMVVTDLNGIVLEGALKPSSEISLHLFSYNRRPDIGGVVHAHAPYTTAYAVANRPIVTKAYPEMIVFFDEIPLADYGTPSTDEIFHGVEKYIKTYDAILLANHGIMTVGKSVSDAFFKLEAAESIARVLTLAKIAGGEKELPADKLQVLYDMRNSRK